MKSKFPSRHSGLTLIEVLIACSLTAIVVAGVCGVYYYALRLWERGLATNSAYSTAVLAFERIEKAVDQARDVYTTSGGTELVFSFQPPRPTDFERVQEYAPTWSEPSIHGSTLSYWNDFSSQRALLYLSDSSGVRGRPGKILWLGEPSESGYVGNAGWSLIPGTNQGRVSPIESISFTMTSRGVTRLIYVTITVKQEDGTQSKLITITRRLRARNLYW